MYIYNVHILGNCLHCTFSMHGPFFARTGSVQGQAISALHDFRGTAYWLRFTDFRGREITAYPIARSCTDWMGSPPCTELHGD